MRNRQWLVGILVFFIAGCIKQPYDAQGYIEGYFTYISANFAGILQALPIKRGDHIKPNQLLFVLDLQPESDAYKQALARKDQAAAELVLAQAKFARQAALLKKGAAAKEIFDISYTELAKAQAQLTHANADLKQALWTQSQKTVAAVKSATVFDTYYLPGELVPAGRPIVSLLAPQDIYLLFFIAESQLSTVHYNQTVYGYYDGSPNPIVAKITFISPKAEYTPQALYSTDTRNKLVFRVEATPTVANANLLHPGQPISVKFK